MLRAYIQLFVLGEKKAVYIFSGVYILQGCIGHLVMPVCVQGQVTALSLSIMEPKHMSHWVMLVGGSHIC